MSEEDTPPPSPYYSLFIKQLEQLENETESINNDRIFQYLFEISTQDDLKVNDYFKDLQWLNTSQPLSLHKDLTGLLVVCDFFTYCCINCLHMLPFLEQFEASLESKYQTSVALLGVHSPKFENEKPLASVASALLRHNITHPVCNDPQLKLWNALEISCWPTVVLIGPDGKLLFYLVGEKAITSRLKLYVDSSLNFYKQKLTGSTANLRINLLKDSTSAKKSHDFLRFPTKVALSPSGEKLVIANSQKHSIIVATKEEGLVLHIIGSIGGFKDGPIESALFNSPQGICWQSEEVILVCDTENHAIRKVDLANNLVETAAGNGKQCEDKIGGKAGSDQGLNSPWDIVCDPNDKKLLYIAMAGSHQIWMLDLGAEKENVCTCLAGDGNEEKRNNRFPLKASFAQPSGVAIGNKRRLFIADSESSSVRTLDLGDKAGVAGAVSTLVGGGLDPRDLFAFGDVDGAGSKARLQHPMGVCVAEDSLYIADTFNHKIKKVCLSLPKPHCQTVEIKAADDKGSALFLNEPNDVCVYSEEKLLIADTNNHRLVLLDLPTGIGQEFRLFQLPQEPSDSADVTDSSKKPAKNWQTIQISEKLILSADGRLLQVELRFRSFSGGFKATPEAPQKIQVVTFSEAFPLSISPSSLTVTDLEQNGAQFSLCCAAPVSVDDDNVDKSQCLKISILCDLNLCNDALSCCKMLPLRVDVPVRIAAAADCDAASIQDRQCIEIDV